MAAEAPLQELQEEATCSVCRDFFQDPVLIPECGHNFCRGCLTRSWGTSEPEASCPQCRQTFAPRSLLPNGQLARMAEVARRCGGPGGEEGGSFCPKHREPLKLFCKDHETLICLVCTQSKEHRGHSVIPLEEAFEEYQIKVEDCLKDQKEQEKKIAGYKKFTEGRVDYMLDRIENQRKIVVAEFRELHLWLEGQEKLLLTRMEETEKDNMARKEEGLAKLMEELSSFDRLIQEIEEKHRQPASKLLQDIGSILKKCQAKGTYENLRDLTLDLMWEIWDCAEIPCFLKSATKTLRDTLERGLQVQEVNIILDPDTANSDWLDISKDRKSIKGIKPVKRKYAASGPRRFVYDPYVLALQRFSTGGHFWEVMVGDKGEWAVGVAYRPANMTNMDLQTRHWEFRKGGGKYLAFSPSGRSEVVLTEEPRRICISLNCAVGQLSFFDAETAALLHTFSDASLVGKTLQPSFYLSKGACMTLPQRRDSEKIRVCQAAVPESL